ncbi:MAG: HD domain-containing protein, partial [Candidatus Pacebacteria bacterium]|nr:HD domain-containing protein [Candidatus Paceibacterota bacterium]
GGVDCRPPYCDSPIDCHQCSDAELAANQKFRLSHLKSVSGSKQTSTPKGVTGVQGLVMKQDDQTATGIPVDNSWKAQVYDFALKNIRHPSWGIAHSERDYQMAKSIAKSEKIDMDLEVLFACAFLHDLGGIEPFAKDGVDHAVRSAELVEPLLQQWGFPMAKWPQVKEMILGHTYYGPAPISTSALAFRDADVLDFLGSIGVARILAVTEEPGRSSLTLKPTVDILRDFEKNMAGKCSLQACRDLAKSRQQELSDFLTTLDRATFGSLAL